MEGLNICSFLVVVKEIPVGVVAQLQMAFFPSDPDSFPDILIKLGRHNRSVPEHGA